VHALMFFFFFFLTDAVYAAVIHAHHTAVPMQCCYLNMF
jgi:hypothetical protein